MFFASSLKEVHLSRIRGRKCLKWKHPHSRNYPRRRGRRCWPWRQRGFWRTRFSRGGRRARRRCGKRARRREKQSRISWRIQPWEPIRSRVKLRGAKKFGARNKFSRKGWLSTFYCNLHRCPHTGSTIYSSFHFLEICYFLTTKFVIQKF